MAQNSTSLWKEYNGKGLAAEYAKYSERATKDEQGNDILSTYATKAELQAAVGDIESALDIIINGPVSNNNEETPLSEEP